MRFASDDLQQLDSRFRAAFANSLTGFKAANLVGTLDSEGRHNLAIMSSAVHLGSHPFLIGLVLRPTEAGQHTLGNILDNRCYTLNHVHETFFEAAHQTAARYDRDISEFEAVGLTPHFQEDFPAPFIAESRIRLGLRLREHHPLEINGTHLLIGEVVLVDVPDLSVAEDGSVDLAASGTVAISGLDTYHRAQHLGRLPYATPAPLLKRANG
jgi:flavin reductase (DIM6/NTAB) family NADH-FMN oxidoreductase RutF